MSSVLIYNVSANKYLGVDSQNPSNGSIVELVSIDKGKQVYALWQIKNVPGGQKIVLQNKTELQLDINADRVFEERNGTGVIVTRDARYRNSNIWSTDDLPQIVSQSGQLKVLNVNAPGSSNDVSIWTQAFNENQKFKIINLLDVEDNIDTSLIM